MDLKTPGNRVAIISPENAQLSRRIDVHRKLAEAIAKGFIVSCHDVSDGGPAVAAAEMCIASGLGMDIGFDRETEPFRETVGEYLVEYQPGSWEELDRLFGGCVVQRGVVRSEPRLQMQVGNEKTDMAVSDMTQAWRGTLDW